MCVPDVCVLQAIGFPQIQEVLGGSSVFYFVHFYSYVRISPCILISISPLANEVEHLSAGDLPSEVPVGGNSLSISFLMITV